MKESLRRGGGFRTVAYDPETGFDNGESPEWVVVLRSPLEQYSMVPDGLQTLLDEGYEAVRALRASVPGREGWYDQHDSFYLPFTGVRAVARPGPDVALYRRIYLPD